MATPNHTGARAPHYPGGTAHTEQLAGITTVSRNNMFQISSKKIMVVLNEC